MQSWMLVFIIGMLKEITGIIMCVTVKNKLNCPLQNDQMNFA